MNDDTRIKMGLLRIGRKFYPYRAICLSFFFIFLWLAFLDPCLLGFREYCDLKKVKVESIARGRPYWFIPPIKSEEAPCRTSTFNYGSNPFYHKLQNESITSCRRVPPFTDSCGIAEKLFFSEPPASCSHQPRVTFCSLEVNLCLKHLYGQEKQMNKNTNFTTLPSHFL